MASKNKRFNILLYCNKPEENQNAGTVVDHIDAFSKYSRNNIMVWSSLSGLPDQATIEAMDCIVIHYTLSLLYENYIPRESFQRIRDFKGLKVLFIQDEYRRVNFVCERINSIGIDVIFSCAPTGVAKQIYRSVDKNTKILSTLTGYVPEDLISFSPIPMAERKIDVGYRARKCAYFLGRKSYEKYEIGSLFLNRARETTLRCDISSQEKDRIYGSKWIDFIANCKTTLGTESGASLIDFTGRVEYELNRWQAFHPFASFEEVPPKYLEEDGKIDLQVISPRCFEAAALGTVMVMYPGEYSGLLSPGVHYISLEKDFSNFDDVMGKIKDHTYLEEVARNAHADLVEKLNFSYKKFINNFDEEMLNIASSKEWEPIGADATFVRKEKKLEDVKKSILSKLTDRMHFYRRFIWKNLPLWFKFLLSVTLLRKWVYFHLFREES